jgi:hypothetical protein
VIAALLLALAPAVHAEPAARVFAVGDRAAAVYEKRVEFFRLPPQTLVTVGGLSAFGPLPATGEVVFHPELRASSTIHLVQPIARLLHPERNAARFLVCTGRVGIWETKHKRSSDNMCGVVDVSGKVIFEPADTDAEGVIEALALTADGKQALFEYRHGKNVDSYLVWTEKEKKPAVFKADVRDMELRRVMNRFGLNDWNPEPEKNPKPEPHKP